MVRGKNMLLQNGPFKNMTAEDTLILNWNQVELQTLAKTTAANVLPFSTKEAVERAYLLDGKLYFNEEYIMPADELGIPGSHNIENALAAICVAKLKMYRMFRLDKL